MSSLEDTAFPWCESKGDEALGPVLGICVLWRCLSFHQLGQPNHAGREDMLSYISLCRNKNSCQKTSGFEAILDQRPGSLQLKHCN